LNIPDDIDNNIGKIDKSQIKAVKLKNIVQLARIVKNSEPDKSTDTGFWLFDESLKKDYRAYGNIGKAPFYIQYIAYLYDGQVIALRAYSTEYYDKVYPEEKQFNGYVRYIDFQVDSEYKGNNLQVFCNEWLEKQLESEGYKGVTLTCYTESLYEKYLSNGYVGTRELMWRTF